MTQALFLPSNNSPKTALPNRNSMKRNLFAGRVRILFAVLLAICIQPAAYALSLNPSDPPFDLDSTSALFIQDIAYGSGERNELDIFIPTSKNPTPLVIFIHSGGFSSGSKEKAYRRGNREEITTLLDHGVAYASINYPLLEKHDNEGLLKSLKGAARALQFIRQNQADFNIDPSRIVLMGSSAGASTALWLAFHDDMANLNSRDPVERQSTRVRAAVAIEVQASMDIVRWEEVFKEYNFSIYSMDNAEKFYGVESLQELFSPPIVALRQEVDTLRWMDSSDPEVWVTNENVSVTAPTSTSILYHHPYHAKTLHDQAARVGLNGSFYIPKMNIMPTNRESTTDFILRKVR